jgi:hypothetical protein
MDAVFTMAPPFSMRGSAACKEHAEEIRPERMLQFLFADFVERLVRHLERRVVDQNIQLPEFAHGPIDQIPAMPFLRSVSFASS